MVRVRAGVYNLDSEQRSYIAKPADGGHDGAIAAMTFDTHNNRVITGGYDRRIKVWSTDGRLLQNFEVKLAITPLLFAAFHDSSPFSRDPDAKFLRSRTLRSR